MFIHLGNLQMDQPPYPPSPFFIPSFSNPHLTMPHFYFPFFFKGNLIQRVYHAQSQIHWFCRTLLFPSGSQVKCNKNKFTLALKKIHQCEKGKRSQRSRYLGMKHGDHCVHVLSWTTCPPNRSF